MAAFLGNLRNVVIVSFLLALVMMFAFGQVAPGHFDRTFFVAVLRWTHVLAGIMWIGLLYYFNFVQSRMMPSVPAELKPGVSKYIAPEALFWFRWGAAATVLAGILLAFARGTDYALEVLTFGFIGGYSDIDKGFTLMGVGVYLAFVMAFNVWFVIWPNQKIALGLGVNAEADAKAKAAAVAGQFSRINVLLSLPMLTSMAMYQTLIG